LDSFEGPLDLLLYLIQSNELDISKVSISKITDQYLSYIRLIRELNFDMASDFLIMAATLLLWKSRAILPKEEEESEDDSEEVGPSEEDLILQLLEHQRFLAAGDEISQLPRLDEDLFNRPNKRPPIERIWREMNINDLAMGYQECLVRSRKRKNILRKETVSLSGMIREINEKLIIGEPTPLDRFYAHSKEAGDKVVAFLASLELGKRKKLRVHQELTYHPIYIELMEKIDELEISLAGAEFDAPAPL
tara:strand:- start:4169 stop:4915 length:747 start_codon:yes stop_codon:yes gene_type:complete